jgi:hypothetical protein
MVEEYRQMVDSTLCWACSPESCGVCRAARELSDRSEQDAELPFGDRQC